MAKVKMSIELNRELALKLPTFKEKVENGGNMLVVDGTVRGEIMTLIVSWMRSHQDDIVDTSSDEGPANLISSKSLAKDDSFMHWIESQGGSILVELLHAAHHLELWPLFEISCKTIVNMFEIKPIAEVRQVLKLDDANFKWSVLCIKGILKYLSLEKRSTLR